jgi:hypothetical protein
MNNADLSACRSVWCGACYTSDPTDGFYIQDREQFNVETTGGADQERMQVPWGQRVQPSMEFRSARDGDHLMVPFECDTCIFRKLKGRLPNGVLEPEKVVDEGYSTGKS